MMLDVHTKEKVNGCLLISILEALSAMALRHFKPRTKQRVGIETSDILNDVTGMAIPMWHSAICLDPVDKSATCVL